MKLFVLLKHDPCRWDGYDTYVHMVTDDEQIAKKWKEETEYNRYKTVELNKVKE